MDTVAKNDTTLLRDAIRKVFAAWEAYPSAISPFRITGVCDETTDRYVLQHVDFDGRRYKAFLLAHLEIQNGKIWILSDNTEEGLAPELATEGVPKNQIVLAFYPPSLRETGEFAIA